MPLTKPRSKRASEEPRASAEGRYNHLDALGGIEVKAYVRRTKEGGAPQCRVACGDLVLRAALIPPAEAPRC
jgi:hypothetical protein